MAKVRVRMNPSGVRDVLNAPGVQQDLLARAQRIAESASSVASGVFTADVQPGKNRAHAMAKTTDARSIASNAKHNSLLKSMDAGR